MAEDLEIGYKITATVVSIKGECYASHKVGDCFEISCMNTAGLCGFFYHSLFPDLQTFQFGGGLPWWENDTIQVTCPDTVNQLVMKLERSKRE